MLVACYFFCCLWLLLVVAVVSSLLLRCASCAGQKNMFKPLKPHAENENTRTVPEIPEVIWLDAARRLKFDTVDEPNILHQRCEGAKVDFFWIYWPCHCHLMFFLWGFHLKCFFVYPKDFWTSNSKTSQYYPADFSGWSEQACFVSCFGMVSPLH